MSTYGLEALHRLRERQKGGSDGPVDDSSLLDEVPLDAPMDDAVLTVWNGEGFVTWEKWRAAAPLVREKPPAAPPDDATVLSAECGGTKVWLVRDGDRWLMFAGSRKAANPKEGFCLPVLGACNADGGSLVRPANGRLAHEGETRWKTER